MPLDDSVNVIYFNLYGLLLKIPYCYGTVKIFELVVCWLDAHKFCLILMKKTGINILSENWINDHIFTVVT